MKQMEKLKTWFSQVRQKPLVAALGRFYGQADSQVMAIAIAYYLMLSLIPFFIIIANLLPYLPINANDILAYLKAWLPASLYPTLGRV